MDSIMQLTLEPYPDMINAVHSLRESGLKTALLTNNWYNDDIELATNQTVVSKYLGPLFDVVSICWVFLSLKCGLL